MNKYIVVDENTLCYRFPGNDREVGILSTLPSSNHSRFDGLLFLLDSSKVRPATVDDFKTFRITLPPDFGE